MIRVGGTIILSCVLAVVLTAPADEDIPRVIRGAGQNNLSGFKLSQAKKHLERSLNEISTGGGPHYRLGRIITARLQIVSAWIYRYKAELVDGQDKNKNCDISIWSTPWMFGEVQVTFNCDGEQSVVRSYMA